MTLILCSQKRPGDYPITIGSGTIMGHYFDIHFVVLVGKATVDAYPSTIHSLTCLCAVNAHQSHGPAKLGTRIHEGTYQSTLNNESEVPELLISSLPLALVAVPEVERCHAKRNFQGMAFEEYRRRS